MTPAANKSRHSPLSTPQRP